MTFPHCVIAEQAARTEALCRRDRAAAHTRDLLLGLEAEAHATGWDGPDSEARVFHLVSRIGGDEVGHRWWDKQTAELRQACETYGFSVGEALVIFAEASEMLRAVVPPGVDAYTPGEGWRFLGVGLRSEVWCAPNDGGGYAAEHPDRWESRNIWAVCRDGRLWSVTRRRGQGPQVLAVDHESDVGFGGDVVHALSRMANALASNPVPVWPA